MDKSTIRGLIKEGASLETNLSKKNVYSEKLVSLIINFIKKRKP